MVAFKQALPDYVPGGKKDLFGGYGPLSSFSQCIKLAVAFNVVFAIGFRIPGMSPTSMRF